MTYRKRRTNRTKKSPSGLWFILSLLVLSGWIVWSAIAQKSTTQVWIDTLNNFQGKDSNNKSNDEWALLLAEKERAIVRLKLTIDSLQQASPYPKGRVVTNEDALNMRSEPSISSSVLIRIPNQAIVEILYWQEETLVLNGESGRWGKVRFNKKEGWVWSKYIEMLADQ